MASSSWTAVYVLILRLVTLALLAASLAIIATDKFTDDSSPGVPPDKYTFKDVYAYRYLLSVAAVGCAYALLQVPVAAVTIARRKRALVGGALLSVCADVVAALLLATGGAAAIGFTYDTKRYLDREFDEFEAPPPELDRLHRNVDRFLALGFVSAGLMLGTAAFVALTIIVTVKSLVK